MLIEEVTCPSCGETFIVDRKLWEVGTVRLRCPICNLYFLPPRSPRSASIEQAAGASVPIEIWEPEEDNL